MPWRRGAETGTDRHVVVRDVRDYDSLFFERRLTDESFAKSESAVDSFAIAVGVTCEQLQFRFAAVTVDAIYNIEDALLRGDDRRQLGQNHSRNREQIALALKHSTEFGQVRFQPVLLVVSQRRVAEISDHLVDVVFYECDLALSGDLNRASEIACCDRGCDVGNRTQLRR